MQAHDVPAMKPAVRTRPRVDRRIGLLASLFAGHAVLGILMGDYAIVATIHALACGFVGVVHALTTRRLRTIPVVVSYIAGSEVLWRMNRADVFYEFGKYVVGAILMIAMLRMRTPRNRALALTYLGLLLPSVLMTFNALDVGVARQEVAFNLSGPATIALAVIFFSNIKLQTTQLHACFAAFIAPVVGIAAVLLQSTVRSEAIDFANASNYITSGGFGPNQVSAMLGLAVLFLILISFERRLAVGVRAVAIAIAALFAGQSALTFARGGIGLALAGALGAVYVLMRGSSRARITVVVVAVLCVIVGKFVVEPKLDRLTQGKLAERYTSGKSSGRELFISSELEMFSEHPILGVGPGVGKAIRDERGLHAGPSHTEYTRMLAEHGILGIISLGCLITLLVRGLRQTTEPSERATTVALLIWAALFLSVYGTRLVAPSIAIGLIFATRPTRGPR